MVRIDRRFPPKNESRESASLLFSGPSQHELCIDGISEGPFLGTCDHRRKRWKRWYYDFVPREIIKGDGVGVGL